MAGRRCFSLVPLGAARREPVVVAVIAISAACLNWWATRRFGLGMSNDSFFYAGSADWIKAGRGLGYWLDPDETHWPLGLPVLIATVSVITRLDVRNAALVVQLLALAMLPILVWRASIAVIRSALLRVIAAAVVALSVITGTQGRLLLTGTVSSLVMVATVFSLMAYLRHPTVRLAVLIGVLCSIAFVIRYQGLILVFVVIAVVLLLDRRPRRQVLGQIVPAAAAAIPLPAAQLILNLIRTGGVGGGYSVGGDESEATLGAAAVVKSTARAVGGWSIGRSDVGTSSIATGSMLLVVSAVVLAMCVREVRRDRVRSDLPVPLLCSVAFVTGTVVLRGFVTFDVDSRTLVDAFAPFVLGCLMIAEHVVGHIHLTRRSPAAGRLALLLGLVWSLGVVGLGVRGALLFATSGAGVTSRDMQPVVQELRFVDSTTALDSCNATKSTDPKVSWLVGREDSLYRAGDPLISPWCVIVTDNSELFGNEFGGVSPLFRGEHIEIFRG